MDAKKLITELELGIGMVESLLAGVTPAEAVFKPAPEAWSMLEVLCHLCDEEINDFRQRVEYILHHPGEAWPPIDPVGWVTAHNYAGQDFEAKKQEWLAERQKSLAWLRSLENPDWETESVAPWGATMKAGDMLASWVAHDGLHIRQLVELRRARAENLVMPYDIRYAGDW